MFKEVNGFTFFVSVLFRPLSQVRALIIRLIFLFLINPQQWPLLILIPILGLSVFRFPVTLVLEMAFLIPVRVRAVTSATGDHTKKLEECEENSTNWAGDVHFVVTLRGLCCNCYASGQIQKYRKELHYRKGGEQPLLFQVDAHQAGNGHQQLED